MNEALLKRRWLKDIHIYFQVAEIHGLGFGVDFFPKPNYFFRGERL
jgi:hypothetical protein